MSQKMLSKFVEDLDYYEKVNLLIGYFLANDTHLSRVEAYEKSLTKILDDGFVEHALSELIGSGPTKR